MTLFGYRLVGAALLDRSIYEGIEADRSALGQALLTVLLASVAAGVGSAGWRGPEAATVVSFAALALVAWTAWAMLISAIGGRFLRAPATRTSTTELMRTLGFATSPGLLQVFAAFPGMTAPIFVMAWVWMFAATVVAVRQALDFGSTGRTLAVCAVAAGVCLAAAFVLSWLLGPLQAPA
jgi:hypothetical protein